MVARDLPLPSALLQHAIAGRGLQADPEFAGEVTRKIAALGRREYTNGSLPNASPLSASRAEYLLGTGSALTEFLIAPVPASGRKGSELASLGGIVNLMVVVCDHLLDRGASVDEVLPPRQLAAYGGGGSPVVILLREYFRRLLSVVPDGTRLYTFKKVVCRMFAAEIQTLRTDGLLPYRFWLQKSSLPFVLMALPAWSIDAREQAPARYLRHLRWLFRVGRFFGALDDAVDFLDDCSSGHPNLWNARREQMHGSFAQRVANWGEHILATWDSLVPRTSEHILLREVFLHMVWGWLKPEISGHGPW